VRAVPLLAALLMGGCAAPLVVAPEPFPGAVRVTAGTQEVAGIPWSAERPLRWSDFQGPPLISSPAAAVTAYVLNYDGECLDDRFTFSVTATFLPDRSWVKPPIFERPLESAIALQHEQTHFDLGELHARRMRRALAALSDACAQPVDELDVVVQRLLNEDIVVQRQYDRETSHGANHRRQAEWDARVRRELGQAPAAPHVF
jgi:hypothetical protein